MNKLKIIIIYIFKIIYYFFPYNLLVKIYSLQNKLYTFWVQNIFKVVGTNLSIKFPINIRGGSSITLGDNVSIGTNVILNYWGNTTIKSIDSKINILSGVSIGDYCHITALGYITIGNNVLFGRYVLVSDNSHGDSSLDSLKISPSKRNICNRGRIIIGDDVWIGDKVTILGPVLIGNNSIIAANSVVNRNVPPYSIVAGVPARVVKKLI